MISDVDPRMTHLLDDAVPEPPRTLNPALSAAGPMTAAAHGGARSLRTVMAIAATTLLIAGVVAMVMASLGPGRPPETTASQSSIAAQARGNSPRAVTIRVVERLLRAAPLLPGSERRQAAPAPEVRNGIPTPSTPNLIRRITWSVAPGSMADALAYFAAHRPRGFRYAGSGTYTDHGVVKTRYASYTPAGRAWQRPNVYTHPELTIAVTPLGDHVGVGIYADAIWLDPRPANADIPRNLTAVRAVVERHASAVDVSAHDAPTVRKTLGRHDARLLARLINALPANQKGAWSCPSPIGKDTLTFNDAARTTVTIDVGGCGSAEIAKNEVTVAGLGFGSTQLPSVDAAVLRAMGLPSDYGYR